VPGLTVHSSSPLCYSHSKDGSRANVSSRDNIYHGNLEDGCGGWASSGQTVWEQEHMFQTWKKDLSELDVGH
jgi:hypothetical protein